MTMQAAVPTAGAPHAFVAPAPGAEPPADYGAVACGLEGCSEPARAAVHQHENRANTAARRAKARRARAKG